jgi:hypothetical protein
MKTLTSVTSSVSVRLSASFPSTLAAPTVTSTNSGRADLDRLLSLDTAHALIHTSRESLKCVEAFSGYSVSIGLNVQV